MKNIINICCAFTSKFLNQSYHRMLIFWSILFSLKFGKTVSDLNSKQCHILIRQNSTYIFMQEKHASKWSFNSEYQCTVSIAGLGIRINFLLFRVQLFFSIRIQLHTTNTLWRVCSDLNFNKFTIINNFNAFSVFLILFFFSWTHIQEKNWIRIRIHSPEQYR